MASRGLLYPFPMVRPQPRSPPPDPLETPKRPLGGRELEDLGALVRRHRVDDTVAKTFTALGAVSLTVVDDIGLLPISQDAAEGLHRLVDASYERRSLALSSNLHSSGFDQLMDKTIASALVGRLMHHAHVIVTDGESVRRADAMSGKGWCP